MTMTEYAAKKSAPFEGWYLTGVLSVSIAFGALARVAAGALSSEAFGSALRMTARSSLVLFCLAYGAAAMHRLFPSPFTCWQRRNRRQLGLSFAASHAVHGLTILGFAYCLPEAFAQHLHGRSPIPGLVAYGFILAMTLTSFDRAQSWLGMRRWRIFHAVGGLYIWAAFVNACLLRVAVQPLYLAPLSVLMLVMGLRIWSWRNGRNRGASNASG